MESLSGTFSGRKRRLENFVEAAVLEKRFVTLWLRDVIFRPDSARFRRPRNIASALEMTLAVYGTYSNPIGNNSLAHGTSTFGNHAFDRGLSSAAGMIITPHLPLARGAHVVWVVPGTRRTTHLFRPGR